MAERGLAVAGHGRIKGLTKGKHEEGIRSQILEEENSGEQRAEGSFWCVCGLVSEGSPHGGGEPMLVRLRVLRAVGACVLVFHCEEMKVGFTPYMMCVLVYA